MRLRGAWGEVELLDEVAEGFEARVYRGRWVDFNRQVRRVAIKRPLDLSVNGRVLWEARWTRQRKFPSPYFVKPVLRMESDWGDLYVEPWIRGETLSQIRARDPKWLASDALVLQLGRQMLRAWRSLQSEGLVHGDFSPHNVMLDESGGLAILDVHAGDEPDHLRLTAAFAAPERLAGEMASSASDLYSLGRLLAYCQEGRECQALVHEVWPGLMSEQPANRHARPQRRRVPRLHWMQAHEEFVSFGLDNCASRESSERNLVDS
jgi:serine/threonine protein kinase